MVTNLTDLTHKEVSMSEQRQPLTRRANYIFWLDLYCVFFKFKVFPPFFRDYFSFSTINHIIQISESYNNKIQHINNKYNNYNT